MNTLIENAIRTIKNLMATRTIAKQNENCSFDCRPQNLAYLRECSRILLEMEISLRKLKDHYNINDVELDYFDEIQSQIFLFIKNLKNETEKEEDTENENENI